MGSKMRMDDEVQEVAELQRRIQERLKELGFRDRNAEGSIIHHLAEVAQIGRKLAEHSVPTFLSVPKDRKEDLGDVIVDIKTDLDEMREAIQDMEVPLVKLMNFLNP